MSIDYNTLAGKYDKEMFQMNNNFYEELSMNAHPSLRTQLYDGWVLRFSNGYTNRANSINPIYPGFLSVPEKVISCEEKYTREGLPVIFKLTDASPTEIDVYLSEQGYEKMTLTNLFVANTFPSHRNTSMTIVRNHIDSAWREHFFRLNGLTDIQKIKTASAMMDNIQSTTLCAQIEIGGNIVACGLCVVEHRFAGLYDIVVDSAYRQKGFGYDLCSALLSESTRYGAKSAYLQVIAANAPAIALYKKLKFQQIYQYWYRVKDMRL